MPPRASIGKPRPNSLKDRDITRHTAAAASCLSTLLFFAILFDSLTYVHAATAGFILAVLIGIRTIRPRPAVEPLSRKRGRGAILGSAVRSAVLGVIVAFTATSLVSLAAILPPRSLWTDRDRSDIEDRVRTLVAARSFKAAADLLESRLTQPVSPLWRDALQQQHVDALISAGESAAETSEKSQFFSRAKEQASVYDVDDRLPRAMLDSLAMEEAQKQAVAKIEADCHLHLNDLIAALADIRSPEARDAALRAIERHVAQVYWPANLPQAILDNLLNMAEATQSLDERADRLRAILAEAAKRNLDPKLAKLQLTVVEQELQRQAPIVMPSTATVHLKAVHGQSQPAIAYDVAIASPRGSAIENLTAKDFVVHDANQQIVRCEVAHSIYETNNNLSVVALLDYSPSTEPMRNSANAGVAAMTSAAPPGTQFRVLAFHEDVVAITDWTDKSTEIDSRLRAFKTSGSNTSLRRAIAVGVAELANRTGTRLLILFTDGKSTTDKMVNDAELVTACRDKSIRVLTIGLESPALDEALLSKLAAGTGGKYYAASRQEELIDRFRSLQLTQSTPVYRIAMLASPGMKLPLELVVGSGPHALRMSLPAAPSQQ